MHRPGLLGRALTATMAAAGVLAVALVAPTAFAQTAQARAEEAAGGPHRHRQLPPRRPPAAARPQLMYSPWMKICGKGPDTGGKQVCVITKDGRLENGMPVAIVQLFEPEGGRKFCASPCRSACSWRTARA